MKAVLAAAVLFTLSLATPAAARPVCLVIADGATGEILIEQGDCHTRVTPASTFKVPLAVMGYDAGILTSPTEPTLPFREGYADWGGDTWRRPTNPTDWMRYSVVWYSQQIAAALGVDELRRYAEAFHYGNTDFAGDPGKNNALERAWISSSLKISPVEQVAFMRELVNGTLPVGDHAIEMTKAIVEANDAPDGWTIWGKTGSAYPRLADGTLDRAHGWGWFVGWAVQDGRTLVFARLDQDEERQRVSGGLRARDAFIAAWPGVLQD